MPVESQAPCRGSKLLISASVANTTVPPRLGVLGRPELVDVPPPPQASRKAAAALGTSIPPAAILAPRPRNVRRSYRSGITLLLSRDGVPGRRHRRLQREVAGREVPAPHCAHLRLALGADGLRPRAPGAEP